jgi:2-polyprenyl-6-methoxyphenol hydroxylase-like FAD-dependent oxidoreductase
VKILIIGGGIAGLATAIALRRQGIDAQVYERAAELREVGAGLSLWRNALVALDALGVGDACRALSAPYAGAALRRSDGRIIVSPAESELKRLVGEVGLVLHRATLQQILAEALGPDHLHLGRTCLNIKDAAHGVTASFEGTGDVHADGLVGADGLHSVVRRAILGSEEPVYSGYTAWRGVTTFDHAELAVGESWGPGQRFGQVPMAHGEVYWFATQNAPAGARASDGEKAEVLRLFSHWHQPIASLVERTDRSAVLRNDIYDRPPARTWSRGRVTMVGDAAHPMTPNLGQGACQALEDAVVLARAVHATPDIAAAWQVYERTRRSRAASVTLASRRIGALGQMENPLAIAARDALVGVLGRFQVRQIVSLVSYNATTVPLR